MSKSDDRSVRRDLTSIVSVQVGTEADDVEQGHRQSGAWSKTWCLSPKQRNLLSACLAHVRHDGYTDQLYAFLPNWQPQFGLPYAGVALARALYYAIMGCLQIPANRFAKKFGPRAQLGSPSSDRDPRALANGRHRTWGRRAGHRQ